ncbi:MAG: ABC transporter substrate-binding protein [Thermomicrobiales bacterium]
MSNTTSGSVSPRTERPGHRMSRRAVLRGAVGGAAVAAVMAFPRHGRLQPGTPARGESRRGGRPVVALARVPTGEELAGAGRPESAWIGSLCHDTLTMPNEHGQLGAGIGIAPVLSPEGRELTVGLRQGVIFPDGSRLSVEDVVASLERVRATGPSSAQGWRLEHVERIEAVDDDTIRLTLSQPDSALLGCLSSPSVPILPASVARNTKTYGLPDMPAGSGPFSPGAVPDAETYEFDRNGAYWQVGRPFLDGVTVTSIPEDTQRTIALVTGGVDFMVDVPMLDIPSLKQDPNITLVGGPSTRACILIPNVQQGAMGDKRLRALLSGAIDRPALVTKATANEASGEQTIFPKETWPGLDQPPAQTDWAQTRKDLTELGYPIGVPLRLIADEREGALANAAVLMQEQLAYAGISLTLDLLDEAALRRAIVTRDYDLYITYTPPWTDPHELVRPLLMTDAPANLMGYRSARVDHLIRRAVMVSDLEARAEIYRQLQRILLDELPVIVLFFPNYYDAMSSRLQDYRWFPPVRAYGMRTAWMESATPAG